MIVVGLHPDTVTYQSDGLGCDSQAVGQIGPQRTEGDGLVLAEAGDAVGEIVQSIETYPACAASAHHARGAVAHQFAVRLKGDPLRKRATPLGEPVISNGALMRRFRRLRFPGNSSRSDRARSL